MENLSINRKNVNKKLIRLFIVLTLTFLLGIILMIFAMNIGGNYFSEFMLFGRRGYEAFGILGFLVGISMGLIFCIFLFKVFKTKK